MGNRGRPKGMYRGEDGLWRYADGTLTANSVAKMNGNATQNNTQSVTRVKDIPTAVTPVVDSSAEKPKMQGIKTYSRKEIDALEAQTGLTLQGWFADGSSACLIPVFLRTDHDDDRRAADMAHIRSAVVENWR